MRIARAILAFVAAWSIALAPAVAGYAPGWAGVATPAHVQHQANARDHSLAGNHGSAPCLHHNEDQRAPAKKSADDCGSMSGCALCHATALASLHFTIANPATAAATLSWHASESVPATPSAGPFRPPRS